MSFKFEKPEVWQESVELCGRFDEVCIYLAKRGGIISDTHFDKIYQATDHFVMRIQALRKSIYYGGLFSVDR